MILIGDIHGLFYDYRDILRRYGKDSLQLGDFGLGFRDTMDHVDVSEIPGIHRFLRGNHDNPDVCRRDKSYIGDYGYIEGSYIGGSCSKLFYISGAWSIDQDSRTPGISWWEDEQLSYEELSDASNKYLEVSPGILCSHDCPTFCLDYIHNGRVIPTRTSQAMDIMFSLWRPSYWIFAHHHVSWRRYIDGCWFICLNELEVLDISGRIIKTNE